MGFVVWGLGGLEVGGLGFRDTFGLALSQLGSGPPLKSMRHFKSLFGNQKNIENLKLLPRPSNQKPYSLTPNACAMNAPSPPCRNANELNNERIIPTSALQQRIVPKPLLLENPRRTTLPNWTTKNQYGNLTENVSSFVNPV